MSRDSPRPHLSCVTHAYRPGIGQVEPVQPRDEKPGAGTAAPDELARPGFWFLHETERRFFRLTSPDGETHGFRDHPTLYLCVEPDNNGVMRRAMKFGPPVYLYPRREGREGK